LILGGVFDRFPKLQIIVGHQFETLSWWAWRADYAFSLKQSGLKRTIKEYLRENFYGGILAGEFIGQTAGEMDSGWSGSNNASSPASSPPSPPLEASLPGVASFPPTVPSGVGPASDTVAPASPHESVAPHAFDDGCPHAAMA
jgi:hypothetical protein